MKRNIIISRNYINSKLDSKIITVSVDGKKNFNLMPNLQLTIPVDEKAHKLTFVHLGLLGSDIQNCVIPAGTEDTELTVSFNAAKKISVSKVNKYGTKKTPAVGGTPDADTLPGGLSRVKLQNKLKQLLDPSGGKLYKALVDADSGSVNSTSIRVELAEQGIHFHLHAGMAMKLVHTILYSSVRITSSVAVDTSWMHNISNVNAVMQYIYKYVNGSGCPAVRMTGDYIVRVEGYSGGYVKPAEPVKQVKPENPVIPAQKEEPVEQETPAEVPAETPPAEKPEHPDMYQSMTSWGLWMMLHESFGEGSSFEKMIQNAPVTCLVAADREVLRVTVLFESDEHVDMVGNGGTTVLEYKYTDASTKKFMADLESGKTITGEDMLHNFDTLEHAEDQAELVDYLMYLIEAIPHVIVEGSSFRSRREGEEIIDIEHSLTAKVMSHRVLKLFGLDGEAVNVLRHSNVAYCQLAAYKESMKFFFVDFDDEVPFKLEYDFTELADEDFLSGEGCFRRLTCTYEQDQLEEYFGRALCDLPYLKCAQTSDGEMFYSNIYLNKDIVPGLDEPFVPAAEADEPDPDPAKFEEPDEPSIPDIPEGPDVPEEPEVQEIPEMPDIPVPNMDGEDFDEPVYTVQSSPTTWSMVQYLNMQFGQGGALARFMKDSQFNGAEVKPGQSELMICFWKYSNNTPETTMLMQYSQFNRGAEGEFEGLLSDMEMDELETILKNTVPYFK